MIVLLQKLIEKYNSREEGLLITTDLEAYVDKLMDKAIILTFHESGCSGFIAFYANNTTERIGFLSMLLVDKTLRGKGVGYQLYKQSENVLRQRGFKTYQLEVLSDNLNALKFYKGLGFYEISRTSEFIKMQKDL
jgi:ribosomal protein S18 acetylase RimI-like enzyme